MGTQPDPASWGRKPKRSTGLYRPPAAAGPPSVGWRTIVDDGLASASEGFGDRVKGAYRDVAENRAGRAANTQQRYGRTLFMGTSRDNGRTARVLLYPDRVERVRTRSISSLVGGVQDNEVTPVRSITSVQVRKENLLWSVVTVYASANAITFRMSHNEARSFRDSLTKLVLKGLVAGAEAVSAPEPQPEPEVPAAPAPDALDQLRRLGELRELGVVSDEEFAEKKAELLKRI